eukprot:TRINITY_DN4014_c0_g1_i1.p2 TRINITY_DN4014_c0_g1~~TRINITY_DN4014_c0_g1_i1.p2  ORF type:complete len:173 (+),score=54.89 TRINITY_DN4014_c0_g1_i1:37-555(+)
MAATPMAGATWHTIVAAVNGIFQAHLDAGTKLSDESLFALDFFFPHQEFQMALNIIDRGLLTRVVAQPSGRCFCSVPVDKRNSSEEKKESHFCQRHYCTCKYFRFTVAKHGTAVLCKHQLAVRLAELYPEKCHTVDVTDDEFAQALFHGAAPDPTSPPPQAVVPVAAKNCAT